MTSKVCTKCKVEKDLAEFAKRPGRLSGYDSQCKVCHNARKKRERAASPSARETHARWVRDNWQKVSDAQKRWYYNNHQKKLDYKRAWERANPEQRLLRMAKLRAKHKGISFAITLADIVIPERCPVLGMPLARNINGNKAQDSSPTLDRKDQSQGYVPGNVFVISYRANRLKGDATLADMRGILAYMES